MNYLAFEVTEDDVATVIERESCITRLQNANLGMGLGALGKEVSDVFDELDFDAIENAALYGNDLTTQTNYAHDEIENQIIQIITQWHSEK